MQLQSRQVRAARALLDWSQEDLAKACQLSIATIRNIEMGVVSPRGKTYALLRETFEGAGLEFIEPNGVRQKLDEIAVFEGVDGIRAFFDDVYRTVSRMGGDVVIGCADPNSKLSRTLAEYPEHIHRMTQIKDQVEVLCLLPEGKTTMPGGSYCTYRCLSRNYVDSVPFYVYGDKSGIRVAEKDTDHKIIVIQSASVAASFRRQFYSMWDKATPVAVAPSLHIIDGTEKKRKTARSRA